VRKVSVSFGLWLLLLLGQHGAVLHEIGHLSRAASTEVTVQADGLGDKTCELCLGYSQLSTPVGHAVPVVLSDPIASRTGTDRPAAATHADVLTPRSRGPPASRFS